HRFFVSVPDRPLVVEADVVRLAQVVSNLLDNAAKYTPRGGTVRLTLSAEEEHAVFRVRDDGVGISQEWLSKIFEPFMQINTSIDRATGGLGIGLALVKSLVDLHGGVVEAVSDGVGTGSEFVVRIPLVADAPAPRHSAEAPPRLARMARVLVVDDDAD